MTIKEYFKKQINMLPAYYYKLVGSIYRIASKDNMYIIVIDGGICSQIDQYVVGNYLESLGHHVRYNIKWFELEGKDTLGEQDRKFDLLKLFPYFDIPLATDEEIRKYRRFYLYYNEWDHFLRNLEELPKPPRYLAGYGYEMPKCKREWYHKIFRLDMQRIVLDEDNKEMLDEISREKESIGMHVRRGDLAEGGIDRGAVEKDYFVKAVNCFGDGGRIFLFSDGMDWVKKELLDILPGKVRLVEINQSDKGWCDLILLSKCKYQIASQSKLGYHAFLLNEHAGKKICVPDMAFSRRLVEFNQIEEDEVYYI